MKLFEYIKNKPRGSLKELAKKIDAHEPDLSRWIKGERPVPVHHAINIEIATKGEVTRKDLRPNDWFKIWPDLSKEEV